MDLGALFKSRNLKLALFGFIGVALILVGTIYGARSEGTRAQTDGITAMSLQDHTRAIERMIEEAVGSIEGVGKVKARVTLESGPESVYAENVTRSSTSQTEVLDTGSKRESVTENETSQPVSGRFGATESPLLERIIPVKVAGCLVVAEGASSSGVKADIYRAMEALLGIPMYRIEVAPMKGGK